jgi:ATP-dependent helicase/nuclease subunit B
MSKDIPAKPSAPNSESRIPNHYVYTGSFAALEARWMAAVAELQQEDPLAVVNVLVGSNILASYLKRRLARQGCPAANIRFHTFLDLVLRLAGDSGTPSSSAPHLPPLGAPIILEAILEERVPQVYAALSGYKGFRDALLETFRDLRDAGISPDELESDIRSGRRSSDRNNHLLGFAGVYRQYRQQAGRFHDVDDDFRIAIHQASRAPSVFESSHLMIYGIYDATGQQSELLAALKLFLQLSYFIPSADAETAEFVRPFLESCVGELGVQAVHLSSPLGHNSLGLLAEKAFGFSQTEDSSAALPSDGSFAMVSAPGETRTAIEIIREIFRALQDGTIAGFHEAAVVLRQPDADLPILTEMFRLRGIPHFIQGGVRFSARPISKAVLALSRLELANFSHEAILVAMELVAAALPESSAANWDVENWRVLTNEPQFLAGLRSWDTSTQAIVEQLSREVNRLESQTEFDEDHENAEVSSIKSARERMESAQRLRESWLLMRQAAADWPESLSWREWARFLEQRFSRLLERASDWRHFLAVLDKIANLEVLDQLEIRESRLGFGCSSKRLRSALEAAIASLSCPSGRFQRSGVNLLSASAARGLRFPLVIIPGLDEGRFPAKLRQDPLLPDSERKRLKSLPLKSKRIEEEKLLFDMAARSAEKRLVLMTSRLDEGSDRERIPSQFFLRAAAAVRGGMVSMRDLNADTIPGFRSVSLDAPAPELNLLPVDEGEIRLRLITFEKDFGYQALEALAQREPLRLKRPLDYDRARWKNNLTEFDGRIFNPQLVQWTAQKVGTSSGQVSASRFEEYAKCPYYFFLKRVQGLEAWEELGKVEGMDPLERGTAAHAILEAFLKNCVGDSFLSSQKEKLKQSLELLAHRELEKVRPAGMPDLLWEIERDRFLNVLQAWLEFEYERADGEMRIVRLEQSFGRFAGKEESPPFRLSAGKYMFDFRGRIDRVDVSRDGKRARVIDYKTGKMPDSLTRKVKPMLLGGERIQLAVYRGALSVLDEYAPLESVEAEYLYLQPKDGKIRLCAYAEPELIDAGKALPYILEILKEGMENGIFFARTAGTVYPAGHCDYCDFLMICGKDRMKREARKAADPAVVRFFKILEPLQ